MKTRLYALDYLRIYSAFLILFFHYGMLGGDSLKLSIFFENLRAKGNIVMVLFFMLSGFSLYYIYEKEDFAKIEKIFLFYKKRFWSIFPALMVYLLAWMCLYGIEKPVRELLIQLPIGLTGLWAVIYNSTAYDFGGHTWFISIIILCYVATPFLILFIRQLSCVQWVKLAVFTYALCVWSILSMSLTGFNVTTIYSGLFVRGLEFLLGLLVGAAFCKTGKLSNPKTILFALLSILIYLIMTGLIGFPSLKSEFYIIPVNAVLLYSFASVPEQSFISRLASTKFVQYVSRLTFGIYLMQLIAFQGIEKVSQLLLEKHPWLVWQIILKYKNINIFVGVIILAIIQTAVSDYVKRKALN